MLLPLYWRSVGIPRVLLDGSVCHLLVLVLAPQRQTFTLPHLSRSDKRCKQVGEARVNTLERLTRFISAQEVGSGYPECLRVSWFCYSIKSDHGP